MDSFPLQLFDNPIINEVEDEIASYLNINIYKDNKEIISRIIEDEIKLSGVNKLILLTYFVENRKLLIEFSKLLYKNESVREHKEEYPKGEYVPKKDQPITLKVHGLGIGFGITYALYFHFLINKRNEELEAFLNKRRIPYHKKFLARLISYFGEVENN